MSRHGPSRPAGPFAVALALLLAAPAAAQAVGPSAAPAASAASPAALPDLGTAALAARIGARLDADPLAGVVTLMKDGDRLAFKGGSPFYLFGDEPRTLPAPSPGPEGLVVPAQAATAIAAWYAGRAAERASHFKVAAILIDPGHGGKDPGASGEFGAGKDKVRVLEKDIALAAALRVRDLLAARFPDRRVLLTRDDDTYPDLEERVGIANAVPLAANEAVIYVSIHANASFNRNAAGFEVWYLNPDYRRTLVDADAPGVDGDIAPILNVMLEEEFTTESVLLAQRILERLDAAVGKVSRNRGVRAEEWFVVRNARMPSVLVEMGFVTNEAEARLLADPAHLRKISDGIYNGIVDFIDYFENLKGISGR